MYMTGDGVSRNPREALEWYGRCAAKGQGDCVDAIGVYYAGGEDGSSENFTTALKYFRRAAANGGSKTAISILSRMYEYGLGVPLDLGKAVYWYKPAAALGDAKANTQVHDLLNSILNSMLPSRVTKNEICLPMRGRGWRPLAESSTVWMSACHTCVHIMV